MFGVRIFHIARPQLEEITATTITLRNKAEKYAGDYDGWETRAEQTETTAAKVRPPS
jgi:regulator of RNase E activity RraB